MYIKNKLRDLGYSIHNNRGKMSSILTPWSNPTSEFRYLDHSQSRPWTLSGLKGLENRINDTTKIIRPEKKCRYPFVKTWVWVYGNGVPPEGERVEVHRDYVSLDYEFYSFRNSHTALKVETSRGPTKRSGEELYVPSLRNLPEVRVLSSQSPRRIPHREDLLPRPYRRTPVLGRRTERKDGSLSRPGDTEEEMDEERRTWPRETKINVP